MPVPLEDLMTIYPLSVAARHPIIYEMCLNMDEYSKNLGILWRIKSSPSIPKAANISQRLNIFYNTR